MSIHDDSMQRVGVAPALCSGQWGIRGTGIVEMSEHDRYCRCAGAKHLG